MSKTKETARKRVWKRGRDRAGNPYIIDPDGRKYHGTSAEVREAALTPWRRAALAQSLKVQRSCRDHGAIRAVDFAECCATDRLEAIEMGTFDTTDGVNVRIPTDVFIMLSAGSRLVRDDFDEYLAELWEAEISALLDVAQSDTGKREIPLTRHERAALARVRCADGRRAGAGL